MVADGTLTIDDVLQIETLLRKAGVFIDENGIVQPITPEVRAQINKETPKPPKQEVKLKAKTEKKVPKKKPIETKPVETPMKSNETLGEYNRRLQEMDKQASQIKNKGKSITVETKTGETKTYEYDKDPA